MRRTALAIVAIASLITAGCAPLAAQQRPDLRNYTALIPGQSTADDAVALMGKPKGAAMVGSDVVIVWLDPLGTNIYSVGILFGADKRMIGVRTILGN